MPNVSIIIPIYNVEQYLARCLDTIVDQTLKEIEIILVDDGSQDNSGAIAEEYAKKDSRIIVIRKENGGLSSARNAGLEVATGEYIGFVDADDWVETRMFELMLETVVEYEADICLCAHTVVTPHEKRECLLPFDQPVYKQPDIAGCFIAPLLGSSELHTNDAIEGFVCRNLYKRELIHNVRFLSERDYYAEDVVFNLGVYGKAQSIAINNNCYYYYNLTHDSLPNRYRLGLWEKLFNLFEYKRTMMQQYQLTAINRLNAVIIRNALHAIRNEVRRENPRSLAMKLSVIHHIVRNADLTSALAELDRSTLSPRQIFETTLLKGRHVLFLYCYFLVLAKCSTLAREYRYAKS